MRTHYDISVRDPRDDWRGLRTLCGTDPEPRRMTKRVSDVDCLRCIRKIWRDKPHLQGASA